MSRRIKTCALSFAILLLASLSVIAADAPTAFDAANKLYEQGKFAEAAAAYETLAQSGTASAALYYNLGNAFFKSGQLGKALAAYRNAQRIAPRDPELRANIQFVRGQVQAPTVLPSATERWLATLTVNEWTTLVAVVLWLWLGLLVVLQFRPAWKPSLRGWLWFGGVATVAICICLAAAWSNSSASTAIVVAKDAVLHNGPLDEAPGSITVHDGAELTVVDSNSGWLQVRIDSSRTGWIKREQAALVSGV